MLHVAHEQVLDAVLGVAGPAAASVPGAHHPAAHVPDGLDRELDKWNRSTVSTARGSMRRTADA